MVIFLHGRDSNATELASDIFESQGTDDKTFPETYENVKWVFPTAPETVSARFGGDLMSQWFDMWTTEQPHERQESQDLSKQVSRLHDIINEEATLIGYDNLFLAVISQGCAIGIQALLTQEHRLAGFLGLNSWILQEDKLRAKANATALSTPVSLCHTKDDDVINISYGQDLRDKLRDMGAQVTWCDCEDGGHWLNKPKGVDDVVAFVNKAMIRTAE